MSDGLKQKNGFCLVRDVQRETFRLQTLRSKEDPLLKRETVYWSQPRKEKYQHLQSHRQSWLIADWSDHCAEAKRGCRLFDAWLQKMSFARGRRELSFIIIIYLHLLSVNSKCNIVSTRNNDGIICLWTDVEPCYFSRPSVNVKVKAGEMKPTWSCSCLAIWPVRKETTWKLPLKFDHTDSIWSF